jgi:hypothetical protein
MTIIKIMMLVGLFGLTMHLELYWLAAFVGAVFGTGILIARRTTGRSSALAGKSDGPPQSAGDGEGRR